MSVCAETCAWHCGEFAGGTLYPDGYWCGGRIIIACHLTDSEYAQVYCTYPRPSGDCAPLNARADRCLDGNERIFKRWDGVFRRLAQLEP